MLEITFQHSWQILLPQTNIFQLKIIAGNCLACTLSGKVCILAREPSQFSVFEAIQQTDFLFWQVNLLTKYKYILHHYTLFSVKTVPGEALSRTWGMNLPLNLLLLYWQILGGPLGIHHLLYPMLGGIILLEGLAFSIFLCYSVCFYVVY